MKTKCKLIINTANGYCMTPIICESISEATRLGKEGCGFAYRIFNMKGELIKRGFCN